MVRLKDIKNSCLMCGEIDCINLFDVVDKDKLIGGELFIYSNMIHSKIVNENEELMNHICPNGLLLRISCYIIAKLNDLFPNDKLIIICNEIVKDMKTSFFLSMSGHYRQSLMIQRGVFEYFLYGLYFYCEYSRFPRSDTDSSDVDKNFHSWMKGGFSKSDLYLRDIILRGGLISKSENKEWNKLFNSLCKFVHTLKHTETNRRYKERDVKLNTCYAIVEFNQNDFIMWSEFYRKLFFLILYKLLTLFPSVKNTPAGKEALRFLRVGFSEQASEINNDYLNKLLKMRSRIPKGI